jgi:alpha-glucosidase
MTGEKTREVNLNFSFLGEGNYEATILKDGPNAERVGSDYLLEFTHIAKNSKLALNMCRGGGFVILLTTY